MSEHEGERELVLGNKQLLGIFFVAMLLCGVFFAMGYVVGGNSAKAGAAVTTGDNAPSPSMESKREEPTPPRDTAPALTDTVAVPGSEPRMADNPAATGSQPPAMLPQQAAPYTTAPPPAGRPAAKEAISVVGVSVATEEPGASYLQVVAIERPAADSIVKILREKGLPAILTESSKPNSYRVLVGPYHSTLLMADAKNKLKDLGYGDVIIHKP
jgi:DedD protein